MEWLNECIDLESHPNQFHGFEGTCNLCSCPRSDDRSDYDSFPDKTSKGSQSYSRVESGQSAVVDWICLFVHDLNVNLYIVLSCSIAPTVLFQALRAICLA